MRKINLRTFKLLQAMSSLKKMHQRKFIYNELNTSESGVFWAISQIKCNNHEATFFSLYEINSYLNFTKPNLSQTINKLEDKGLAKRVILKENRRATYIELTEKGIAMAEENEKAFFTFVNNIVNKMGAEDTDKFIELLHKFANALDEFEIEVNREQKG